MREPAIHNEQELLIQISNGDEKAFARLYTAYARLLHPFLNALTMDTGVADDLVQQAMLSTWLNRDTLPGLTSFRAWIFRVAANHASTWLRKTALIRQTEKNGHITASPEELDSTSQEVYFREARRLVDQAVDTLSPQRRKIFQLYRHHGLSYTQIAQQLDLSPSTVRTAISLSLMAIREQLTAAGLSLAIIFLGLQ